MSENDIIAELLLQLHEEREKNHELTDIILRHFGAITEQEKVVVAEPAEGRGRVTWPRLKSKLERSHRNASQISTPIRDGAGDLARVDNGEINVEECGPRDDRQDACQKEISILKDPA